MRKEWKGFALGVLFTSITMFGITNAQQITESVQRTYKDIQIMINGTKIVPKDANGNIVEPFLINGTTYLPVRAVGEALGLEVGWNDETSTVTLDNKTNNDRINNSYSDSSNIQANTENKNTYSVNIREAQTSNRIDEVCALTVINYQTEDYNSIVGEVKDGQEWVIVNMQFENMSDSTIVLNKNDFKIVDGAGRYGYKPYPKHLDTELDMIEVRAGQTVTFSVRFVYYKNNEMSLRFYHPSIVAEVYTDIKLR